GRNRHRNLGETGQRPIARCPLGDRRDSCTPVAAAVPPARAPVRHARHRRPSAPGPGVFRLRKPGFWRLHPTL
ncbi:MAG: hypothetical protein AVDCRST_MAG59-2932, partial [uncultured Thermomicrobiales bacterium]